MLDQGVFDFALLRILTEAEEIKAVRVFEGFARQVGLRFGQVAFEVADGLATALLQAVFNVLCFRQASQPTVPSQAFENSSGRIPRTSQKGPAGT